MYVILMGAQGSGKGTQAALIGPQFNLVRLATGDLFRSAIAQKTELGLEVEAILARGDLVSDDLTNSLVRERLTGINAEIRSGAIGGAVFDGYPRTVQQAQALDAMLAELGSGIDAVIEIDVPRDILIARMSGRRVCEVCGTSYHVITNPPKVEGVCDLDGGKLVQRDDDKPEAIARRLEHYDAQTAPVLSHYRAQDLVRTVNGDQDVNSVEQEIVSYLNATGVRAS